MASATPDLRLLSQPHNIPPFSLVILLGTIVSAACQWCCSRRHS